MDQAGYGVDHSRRHGLLVATGAGAVLCALAGSMILADRLLGPEWPMLALVACAAAGLSLALVHALYRAASPRPFALRPAGPNASESSRRRQQEAELDMVIRAARLAQAEADAANHAKTDFLACMSHEIRTPLNSVIGFVGLLLQQPDLAPQARLFGERIQTGGAALLTIVNDILDFSQVEAGVIELDRLPFSPNGLIDECVSLVQHAIVAKRLSLHISLVDRLPAGAIGDAARLRQILLNLLNNAIKFTDEGSVTLDIRRDRAAGDPDRVIFSIIDTGIGIARDDQARLFQRFAQVDASIRRTYGGTGLGLVICRRLVELMGGTIGVDSQRGAGSTFFFSVPLPATTLPAGEVASLSAPVRPLNVLLAEDVVINQELVCQILCDRGHVVDVVGNGAEAVMAVQDTVYDLVLMDLQMPYLDGLAATRMIRALPHPCRDVPIVAMTANVLPEQTASAREAGMVDVIHKPFSAVQILTLMERVTGERRGLEIARTASSDCDLAGDTAIAQDTAIAHDMAILGKLATLLGDAKIRSLLRSLAASLAGRFVADAATAEGREELRRQAHASVAGSGMLGFVAFSVRCKTFQTAEDDGFAERLETLQGAAAAVVATATRLADQGASLVSSAAA